MSRGCDFGWSEEDPCRGTTWTTPHPDCGGYRDFDGTVDIRVGPLHVFIIWREDDPSIEN
jgi:hypothetical protein